MQAVVHLAVERRHKPAHGVGHDIVVPVEFQHGAQHLADVRPFAWVKRVEVDVVGVVDRRVRGARPEHEPLVAIQRRVRVFRHVSPQHHTLAGDEHEDAGCVLGDVWVGDHVHTLAGQDVGGVVFAGCLVFECHTNAGCLDVGAGEAGAVA